jgi:hypothetical protein
VGPGSTLGIQCYRFPASKTPEVQCLVEKLDKAYAPATAAHESIPSASAEARSPSQPCTCSPAPCSPSTYAAGRGIPCLSRIAAKLATLSVDDDFEVAIEESRGSTRRIRSFIINRRTQYVWFTVLSSIRIFVYFSSLPRNLLRAWKRSFVSLAGVRNCCVFRKHARRSMPFNVAVVDHCRRLQSDSALWGHFVVFARLHGGALPAQHRNNVRDCTRSRLQRLRRRTGLRVVFFKLSSL